MMNPMLSDDRPPGHMLKVSVAGDVYVYSPGNGTTYIVMVSDVADVEFLAADRLVTIVQPAVFGGSYPMQSGPAEGVEAIPSLHVGYLVEKFPQLSGRAADALPLFDLIAWVLGRRLMEGSFEMVFGVSEEMLRARSG